MTSIGIRVLGATGIEDYHAHLLRLDPRSRSLCFPSHNDDRSIDAHCLRLLAGQPILIGGYVNDSLRASLEITSDRTARHADAVFTEEPGFCSPALTQMLLARLFDEARCYGFSHISLHGIDDAAWLERAALASGAEMIAGKPLRLRFEAAQATAPAAAAQPSLRAGYA